LKEKRRRRGVGGGGGGGGGFLQGLVTYYWYNKNFFYLRDAITGISKKSIFSKDIPGDESRYMSK